MRFVIQRVKNSKVTVNNEVVGKIGKGFMVLIGISNEDTTETADKMLRKLLNMRIFEDENGKTNLGLQDVGGELLLISQFTLCGLPKGQQTVVHQCRCARYGEKAL